MKLTGPASRLSERLRGCSRPGNLSWSFGSSGVRILSAMLSTAALGTGAAVGLCDDPAKLRW
jgi:hypothetical protein